MTEQKTLSVSILDRDYRVACPPGQEKQLSDAASTLNEKMKEIRDTGRVFGTVMKRPYFIFIFYTT